MFSKKYFFVITFTLLILSLTYVALAAIDITGLASGANTFSNIYNWVFGGNTYQTITCTCDSPRDAINNCFTCNGVIYTGTTKACCGNTPTLQTCNSQSSWIYPNYPCGSPTNGSISPVTCTCDNPGQGAPNNHFRCTDGELRYCGSDEICYGSATKPAWPCKIGSNTKQQTQSQTTGAKCTCDRSGGRAGDTGGGNRFTCTDGDVRYCGNDEVCTSTSTKPSWPCEKIPANQNNCGNNCKIAGYGSSSCLSYCGVNQIEVASGDCLWPAGHCCCGGTGSTQSTTMISQTTETQRLDTKIGQFTVSSIDCNAIPNGQKCVISYEHNLNQDVIMIFFFTKNGRNVGSSVSSILRNSGKTYGIYYCGGDRGEYGVSWTVFQASDMNLEDPIAGSPSQKSFKC